MKAAREGDYRRTLREKGPYWPVRIERLAFTGVPGLGTGEIPFASPVTFFSGPNGVGKSTLLRACWAALAPDKAKKGPGSTRRLAAGAVAVDLSVGGVLHECRATISPDEFLGEVGHEIEVVHIDTAQDVLRQQSLFDEYSDLESYIEGAGSHILTDAELGEVSYLTRRDYRSGVLYEVDSLGDPFPFFEVSYGEDRYDSRTMGAGELAAFFLWWAARRAAKQSILLIEEPETFLSPASQAAVGAYLVAMACEKKVCIVATTHSGAIVSPMSDDSLRFVVRAGGGVVVQADAPAIVFSNLGMEPTLEGVLFTEDNLATAFARAILQKFEPRLARRVDVESKGGDGEVLKSIRALNNTARLAVLGLLDGDLRGKVSKEDQPRCVHLPGDDPVEVIFREMVTKDPSTLGKMLAHDNIPAILASLEGNDLHDWYRRFANELGLEPIQLFPSMFAIWIRDEENEKAARQCVAEILEAVNCAQPRAH